MISIVIPVFNNHDMTHDCINAIRETTRDFELVIVDNGSEPAFKPPFTGFAETILIRNEENKGFPVAVNQGINAARGETILLLNNDVMCTPGSLNRLETWLNNFSIVGPCTNYSAGLQRVEIGTYQSLDGLNKEAAVFAEENAGESEEVNFIIGFCMAFKRSLFDEIGPFDESLWPCSGEEIDFCLRARAAGHKIGIAQDVYVHHEGSRTFNDMMTDAEYKDICTRNDKHLAERWGADFWDRQAINGGPVLDTKKVTIGDHTYGSENMEVLFSGDANLTIGKYCSIGPKLTIILGGEHRTDWLTTYPFSAFLPDNSGYEYRVSKGDVNIGNDVWIGHGVTILSGVTIGDSAVIGAGAVVASNVLPYNIVAGNPAMVKGYRKPTCKWWEWPDDVVYEAIPILQSSDDEGLYDFAKERGLL
jgi:GT2 family glycosyltransferase/acetyltransferase-like isoleucine patch superfamily enzyme